MAKENNKKTNSNLILYGIIAILVILIILGTLAFVGAGAFFLLTSNKSPSTAQSPQNPLQQTVQQSSNPLQPVGCQYNNPPCDVSYSCINDQCIKQCTGSPSDYCASTVRKYDGQCINGNWVYKSEDCSYGCINGACATPKCPNSCDDSNPCTRDTCSSQTEFACKHEPLNGAQQGCSGTSSTCSQFSCSNGNCGTIPTVPCCGNGVCETSETYKTCLSDCPAPSPKLQVEPLGCDTSWNPLQPLSTVNNAYIEVSNIGNMDALNVVVTGQSNKENAVNPYKTTQGGTLRAGYKRAFKVSLYTKFNEVSTVTVTVTSSNGEATPVVFSDCSKIDQGAINNLNWIVETGEKYIDAISLG